MQRLLAALLLPISATDLPGEDRAAADPGAAATGMVAADQRDYADSRNGCAPATLLNLLKFGGGELAPALRSLVGGSDGVRMRFLVDRYFGNRPSIERPGQPRWGVHGIGCRDFAAGTNELLAEHGIEALASRSLRRLEGERETDHLARVRGYLAASLARGIPPMLNLRSYLVKRREEDGGAARWELGVGHYVLVVALPVAESGLGFPVEVIDPWRGRRTELLIHREASGRSFRALDEDDPEGEWLDGRPFLQVLAPEVPSLRPANLDWSERFLAIANHLVGRF